MKTYSISFRSVNRWGSHVRVIESSDINQSIASIEAEYRRRSDIAYDFKAVETSCK